MCYLRLLVLVVSAIPASSAAAAVEAPPIRVPDGFSVERVAGPPLIHHPVMACFDERGRLFVAENAGVNLDYKELIKDPPSSIRMLEDTDGDGVFDKATTFADKLAFPMGACWYDGSLYVSSPPSLWRFRDADGDGVAEERQELVSKFGSIGNAADVHGPQLGPDGWLYWCDGRHGHNITRADGSTMAGKAARVFRCRPDGSSVEVVCGGGMDNPVEVAFTPEGEPLATVNLLHSKPQRVDAIVYALEGSVFPYYEEVIREFNRTGDLMPAVGPIGWVAVSGFIRYRAPGEFGFGKDYENSYFTAQFNTHKVQRHVIERDGAGFRTRHEDFFVSPSPDSHPTDVLEDADGSLLVIDTGGWFRIGCPTSQIAKPQIKGAIYRVRRKGAERPDDPRGLSIPWDELLPKECVALFDDPRPAVRDRAVETLGGRGDKAVTALSLALASSDPPAARRNAVWALARVNTESARRALREALVDDEMTVRLAAAHCAGLNRDSEAAALLVTMLDAEHPAERRQAATALGRLRHSQAVPSLLAGLKGATADRFLEHALIYALVQTADRGSTLRGLSDRSPAVRRGALIALDQMDGGALTPDLVVPLLSESDPALRQAAVRVVMSRADWTAAALTMLRRWSTADELDEGSRASLRAAIGAFANDAAVQDLAAQALSNDQAPAGVRLAVAEAMAQSPLEKLPAPWLEPLAGALQDPDERVPHQAVAALRSAGGAADGALLRLASDAARPPDLRVAALAAAAAPRAAGVDAALFDFLRSQLRADRPPLSRLAAAQALAAVKLNEEQLQSLLPAVAEAGALEMPHLLAAYEKAAADTGVGPALLDALEKAPGLANVSPGALRRTLTAYPPPVLQSAEPLLARLSTDAGEMKAKLDELEPALAAGDPGRGRELFFGRRAACATCHTIASEGLVQGGRVGPDLSKIGSIRAGRDLLESVVFPSASIARDYEPYVVKTRDGKVYSGTLARETADAVHLRGPVAEERVPRSAIESFQPDKVSIMPQGLDAQLTRQELADLIAFLAALK